MSLKFSKFLCYLNIKMNFSCVFVHALTSNLCHEVYTSLSLPMEMSVMNKVFSTNPCATGNPKEAVQEGVFSVCTETLQVVQCSLIS